ncbi:MAG: hypothetical protein JWQ97_2925 [Phenylobacterium sp.]|nr:hypothetical protein [Phenylobacterium sp.]
MPAEAPKPDAGRSDYNASARFTQLQPGEPYFLIRGRDALAGPAVRAWAALAHHQLAPMAIVEQALQQADAMDAWPDKHLPDASHLSDDEVLQLAFQLERRAWHARADSADPKIMLAEERAIGVVMGRLRPVLSVLFEGGTLQEDGSFTFRMPKGELGQDKPGLNPIEALGKLATVLRAEGHANG